MSARRQLRAAATGVLALSLFTVGACRWISDWASLSSQERLKMPAGLDKAGVVSGATFLTQTVFYEDGAERLGVVTDLRPDWLFEKGKRGLGVVGTNGARFLGPDREILLRVDFEEGYQTGMELVRLDSSGAYGFLNRNHSWAAEVMLFDSRGKVLWTYTYPHGVDDAAAGDVDGDGKAEVVVGFNGDGGIHLLDRRGKKIWQVEGGNVWHVEIVDTDGDGRGEVLHSGGRGSGLTILDAKGQVRTRYEVGYGGLFSRVHVADFSLTRWGDEPQADKIIIPDEGAIHVSKASGVGVARSTLRGRVGTVPFAGHPCDLLRTAHTMHRC